MESIQTNQTYPNHLVHQEDYDSSFYPYTQKDRSQKLFEIDDRCTAALQHSGVENY
jgi:hypothetical protein